MRKRRINLWKFLQQLHLQLRTNIFASSFSDDSTSNSPQGNGSRHHSVFTLFFCFPEKCDNSKHINLVFFSTVKGRGLVCLKPFSLFPCFFFGTWRVKPDAFAARQRDEQADVYYDTAKGERDVIFFFSSQCSTWRADQQAERAEWKGSKVTVFNSEGFHATGARTTSTTAGRRASCRSSPYCFRRVFQGCGGYVSFTWSLRELWTSCRWK